MRIRPLAFALALSLSLSACASMTPTSPITGNPVNVTAPSPGTTNTLSKSCYIAGTGYLCARPLVSIANKTPLLKAQIQSDIGAADTGIVAAFDACIVAVLTGDSTAVSAYQKSVKDLSDGLVKTINSATTKVKNDAAQAQTDKTAAITALSLGVILAGVQDASTVMSTQERLRSPDPITVGELQDLSLQLHSPL